MIIFGYKSRPKVSGQFLQRCKQCKRKTIYGLVTVTQWFTLYFIPLIPFSSKSFAICGACGLRNELSREEKEKVMVTA